MSTGQYAADPITSVVEDIQDRMGNGRPPSDETEDSYYDRYEIGETHGPDPERSPLTFQVMDYTSGATYSITVKRV